MKFCDVLHYLSDLYCTLSMYTFGQIQEEDVSRSFYMQQKYKLPYGRTKTMKITSR